jgi:TetR/AcrR family transcriptional regulator, acrAB operon repressor
MRRTKEDAEQTRQSLLNAALEVFSQKGFDAARLEDVAEVAGVTRGAIYHHFGGKAELFYALIDEAEISGSGSVQRAIAEGGGMLDISRRVIVYGLELLEKDSRYRRASELYLLNLGASPELARYQQERREQMAQPVQEIAGYIRIGQAQGEVSADLDPATAAKAFLAYQTGLNFIWLLNPALISIEREAGTIADIFLYGIAARREEKA